MTMTTHALTGSDKEVRWATAIRDETIAELAAVDPTHRADTTRILHQVTDATWWIETRNIPGDEWPARLGITSPAHEQRPLHRVSEGSRQRLADRMHTAERIRAALDTTGVHRTAYGLTISINDTLGLHQIDCSGRTDSRKAARLALADQLVAGLATAGCEVPDEARKILANGGVITIGGQR
ncbi:hypothetical protein ABT336_11795 [Micromonospora sp. NPDC000207]|uniref:hypothetical protein n=1 Tax=Micromonospora sp. NPDC000207 TaxID=3154246 RepID=UPI00333443D7